MGSGATAQRVATGQLNAQDLDYLAKLKADGSDYIFEPVLAANMQQFSDLSARLESLSSDSNITEVQQMPQILPAVNKSKMIFYAGIGFMILWLLLKKK